MVYYYSVSIIFIQGKIELYDIQFDVSLMKILGEILVLQNVYFL